MLTRGQFGFGQAVQGVGVSLRQKGDRLAGQPVVRQWLASARRGFQSSGSVAAAGSKLVPYAAESGELI